MGKLKAIELSTLVGNLAVDAINTQLLFNEAHEADIKRFETLATTIDPTVKEFLQPLVPSRQHLDTFELDFSLIITSETSTALSIQALPIGLGFSILHSSRTERRSRIKLSVKQHPLPNRDAAVCKEGEKCQNHNPQAVSSRT